MDKKLGNVAMSDLANMRILVVDDSRMHRSLLKGLLATAGFNQVDKASSASDMFSILDSDAPLDVGGPSNYDMILLDIIMDDMDGIEACKHLKEDERYRDIPVVMITGGIRNETFEKAFEVGAIDYIIKPVELLELAVRIRSVLRLKQETDKRKQREQALKEREQELESANRELKRLTSLDGLTGIPNRRHFDLALAAEWKSAMMEEMPLSLIFIDIDLFKTYNDRYGHLAGDDCLRQIAKLLDTEARAAGGLATRYEGKILAVILPATDSDQAQTIAKQLCCAVQKEKIPHADSTQNGIVTVSAGISTTTPEEQSLPIKLVIKANKALAESKAKVVAA